MGSRWQWEWLTDPRQPGKRPRLKSALVGSAPTGLQWERQTHVNITSLTCRTWWHGALHALRHNIASFTKTLRICYDTAGYDRMPRQVINKLEALQKKYLAIKDKNNDRGMGHVDWPFYELCQNIYRNLALVNPVRLSSFVMFMWYKISAVKVWWCHEISLSYVCETIEKALLRLNRELAIGRRTVRLSGCFGSKPGRKMTG